MGYISDLHTYDTSGGAYLRVWEMVQLDMGDSTIQGAYGSQRSGWRIASMSGGKWEMVYETSR